MVTPEILKATPNDQRLLAALHQINRLLCELTPRAQPLSRGRLKEILAQRSLHYFAAWDGDRLLGIALLYIKQQQLDTRGDVEDVVVASEARGLGIAQLLMDKLEECARENGVDTLHLTSKPARVAANRLYQGRGYERHHTNLYCKRLR